MSPRARKVQLPDLSGRVTISATARVDLQGTIRCPEGTENAIRAALGAAMHASIRVNVDFAVAGAVERGVPHQVAKQLIAEFCIAALPSRVPARVDHSREVILVPPRGDASVLVVGVDPFDRVVALPASECEELAAFNLANTWGEFRGKAPPAFREAKEQEWLELQQARLDNQEDELDSDSGPELPPDEARFEKLDFRGVEEGDWPFPIQSMSDELPLVILMRHGEPVTTSLNGDYVDIPPFSLEALVRDLELCGYTCRRDDAAICAATVQ